MIGSMQGGGWVKRWGGGGREVQALFNDIFFL